MSDQTEMIRKKRRLSGILVHPTSLPGEYGIGDLGPEAYRFVGSADMPIYWQSLPAWRRFASSAGRDTFFYSHHKRTESGIHRREREAVNGCGKERHLRIGRV